MRTNKVAVIAWAALSLGAVQGASAADANSLARGKEVFDYWCATCHSPGDQFPGTVALGARYKGSVPAALAERKDLSPAVVKHFVRNGISVMPFFRKTEISDVDLDALANYLSSPNKK